MATNGIEYKEFRGVEGLVIAKLLTDDSTGITWDTPREWAGVREISKTTERGSATKYYDNIPAIVIQSEGPDEITLACSVVDLEMDAYIDGKTYDAELGAYIDGDAENNYFAIGYKTKDTKGAYRYVWRYKGTIAKGDETFITEDDGTESNGVEYTFTGIKTTHKFTKGGKAKGIVVDASLEKADVSTFFDAVTTPDALQKVSG